MDSSHPASQALLLWLPATSPLLPSFLLRATRLLPTVRISRAAITAMREECDGVLVFTDLLGGTPFNQSMMIAQDVDNVEVLTGT